MGQAAVAVVVVDERLGHLGVAAGLLACSSRWRLDRFEQLRVGQAVIAAESADEGEGGRVSVDVGDPRRLC